MLPHTGSLPSVQEPQQSIPSAENASPIAKCPIMTPPQADPVVIDRPPVCPVIHTTPQMKKHQEEIKNTPTHLLPTSERLRKALCSAGFASIVTTMITGAIWQPIMTTLVRQQFIGAQRNNISLSHATSSSPTAITGTTNAMNNISPEVHNIATNSLNITPKQTELVKSNVWSVAKNISKEGKRVFFRGLTPRLMQSPLACVQWTTYEMFRETLANKDDSLLASIKYALIFVLSRALTTAAKCPFEVIKERMQVQGAMANFSALSPTSSSYQHLKYIIKTDGVSGLFRALPINICRDIPIAVLMMVGNDFWTHLFLNGTIGGFFDKHFAEDKKKRQQGQKTPTHISFMAGAMSGLVATLLTQPIDVAKTAIQTQSLVKGTQLGQNGNNLSNFGQNSAAQPRQFTGLFDVLKTLRREQGVKSWFVGSPLRAMHFILGGAVYLPLYRTVQQQLKFGFEVAAPKKPTQ
jgi:hypothetical protein